MEEMHLERLDPDIAQLLYEEEMRQRSNIELIASENFVSEAVMMAAGSCLTNKYAEGYPNKRYYGGCEVVDRVEELAIERARQLFGAEHANVQPHSGSQANMAVYFAFLDYGDTIMGMDLAHGGHLTHGSPLSMSGRYFHPVSYGVDQGTERIDYESLREKALETRPQMIVAGASAYPRIIDFERLREIADLVDAYLMVDIAHIAGLVAWGLHPNPVPVADFVTSTTHKTLRGTRGGFILCREEYAREIDRAVFPGIQGGPLMHIIAAKAVGFKQALEPEFKEYQQQILANARALAQAMDDLGFRLVSGGTDTHLLLVDLTPFDMTGKDAENLLGQVGITVNKNVIPFDQKPGMVTSGVRLGTPAVTTRGMRETEMQEIALLIHRTLTTSEGELKVIVDEVAELCSAFPLYRSTPTTS